jgi:iron complex outermembrane recepter protein
LLKIVGRRSRIVAAEPDLRYAASLFMTGYAENAASNEFLVPGMEIITKPFNMKDMGRISLAGFARLGAVCNQLLRRGVRSAGGKRGAVGNFFIQETFEFFWGKTGVVKSVLFATASVFAMACPAYAQQQLAQNDINQMSIEQLANVAITSVSKTAEPLSDAASAVYVISHDDVIRSGATSLPEMLRLAPNLEVMQTSPSNYVITARGFNGNAADQNFSDKLLVLIDGRSVYSPLYSGVYWDMQDVLPEDVERIEVISGPAGALWGANAVNGVINIVTRKASDTQGGYLDLGVGDEESSVAAQYGGKFDDDVAYRVYAKDFYQRALDSSPGVSAHDGWAKPQAGFRLDWTPESDTVTLEGDLYGGAEAQLGAPNQVIGGGNITASWQHPLEENSNLQVLTYYDETERSTENGGGFILNTYDFEVQHNFSLGGWNNIVWGAGERIDQYRITDDISSASSLLFIPPARTLNLADIFAQDRIPITGKVELTLGLKLEDDPYSGWSPMPNARLGWKVTDTDLLWMAVSRAIRSPTPFDVDVSEKLGSATFLTGNPDFLPEEVTAYEAGYRGQISSPLSFSLSLFDNVYDHLKSIALNSNPAIPLEWGNTIEGHVYGLESWATYQAADWWRLSAGFNLQHENLVFAPGAVQVLGVSQEGDDPHHQASLRSSMDLMDRVTFDADFRDVGALPDPKVPEYVELNARLAWHATDRLDVSLSGFNLLHGQHVEYLPGDEIRRNFFLETRWRF